MPTYENHLSIDKGDTVRPPTGRPVVYGTQGVISSGHYLTSMAGMRMLLNGGNAFDAVVAATFAAGVTEPLANYSLLAEGVFMMYDSRSGDLLSLSGQGTAPAKASVDFYKSRGFDEIPTGPGPDAPMSFTVPAVIAALTSMLERYGTKTLGEVLAPAIHHAEFGFPNYEYMLQRLDSPGTREQFDLFPPGGRNVFFENGDVPQPGSLLVQKNLADMLKQMVAAENASIGSRIDGIRAGHDAFYKGDIAKSIAAYSRQVGGILDEEDLANYEPEYGEPIKSTFMGHEISSHSTWTQGIMALQILNMLENFDLKAMGHNSLQYTHTVLEACKLAFADREAFYGDPNHATVPIDGLISKEYAAERAQQIDPERAHPELPAAGDPWKYSGVSKPANGTAQMPAGVAAGESGNSSGTTHIACIDHDRDHQPPPAPPVPPPRRPPRPPPPPRRLVQQGRILPRAGRSHKHAHRDVQLHRRPPKQAGTGQASPHYAHQLHRIQGRHTGHDSGLPRRRPSGAGECAIDAEHPAVRHERPGSCGGAALCHRKRSRLLLPACVLSQPRFAGRGLPRPELGGVEVARA